MWVADPVFLSCFFQQCSACVPKHAYSPCKSQYMQIFTVFLLKSPKKRETSSFQDVKNETAKVCLHFTCE